MAWKHNPYQQPAEGNGVLLFDAWEPAKPPATMKAAPIHPSILSRGLLWLETLMGEWSRFYVLAYFAVTYLNARNVILGGTGDMAIAACCAAIFCFDTLSQVTDVMVEDMPDTLTWQDGPDGTVAKRTMAAFVPDLVVWGDIRMLETILDKIDTGFREVTA